MARPDYPRARWYGAHGGNYGRANRPTSSRINKVVIHCVNGSWSSAINWFRDPRAGVSAHYTIRSSDGFIGQSVEEKDIGYHAGNWPVNVNSIGIEHEGFGNNPNRWFTAPMYNASARLTAHLCRKYGIPIQLARGPNQAGILAHRQATSTYCPGQFDFNRYIRLVRHFANQTPQPRGYQQVVDNAQPARFRAPNTWSVSSFSPQKYRTNYHYTEPANVSQPAQFKINIPRRGRYSIWARWPADPGYNNGTMFSIFTANGWVPRFVNQRLRNGQWFRLGVFTMRRGDYWGVRVSRTARGTGLIIADAVWVREV